MAGNSQLRVGDLLTQNDGVGWFRVMAEQHGAYVLCRVPPGLQLDDYGVKFIHVPSPADPTAYWLVSPVNAS